MSRPVYRLTADVFKTLGHPARIHVLELLSDAELSVTELQRLVGVEPPNLSQQLAVLRRAGMVTTRRQGTSMYYSMAAAEINELLAAARRILTDVITGQIDTLQDLRTPVSARAG